MTKETKAKQMERLLNMDRKQVIKDYAFLSSHMKDLMGMAQLKQVDLASDLKMEKTKLIRRLNDPDLWRIVEIDPAMDIIDKLLDKEEKVK